MPYFGRWVLGEDTRPELARWCANNIPTDGPAATVFAQEMVKAGAHDREESMQLLAAELLRLCAEAVREHAADDRGGEHTRVFTSRTELYNTFRNYCYRLGQTPMRPAAFYRRMEELGFRQGTRHGGIRGFYDVKVR
jgi:hypothetical protein